MPKASRKASTNALALRYPQSAATRVTGNPVASSFSAWCSRAGLALNIPFAVLVKLGQDYLPSRPGTAAGVTLGLSVGGLCAPLLGLLAQHRGPQGVLTVLWIAPLIALGLGLLLSEPTARPVTNGDREAAAAR